MDRVIERLIALLTATVVTPRGIKQVYNGHPMKIPKDSMPAIIVRGVGMRSEILDTQRNQEVFELQIILINDARNKMNSDQNESTIEREVRKIFEERDTGNEIKDDTIMGVVEKEFLYESTYNLNAKINNIRFGAGLDPVFESEFPGAFYGIMDLLVTAAPHQVKNP